MEKQDFERALGFFSEGFELYELGALLLAVFELCDVGQKDLENFEQWESEKYDFSTAFSKKFDLSDWCAEILWLDGLCIGVNSSFWHKLLVSMRYSSS